MGVAPLFPVGWNIPRVGVRTSFVVPAFPCVAMAVPSLIPGDPVVVGARRGGHWFSGRRRRWSGRRLDHGHRSRSARRLRRLRESGLTIAPLVLLPDFQVPVEAVLRGGIRLLVAVLTPTV